MEFLKNVDLRPITVLKFVVLVIIGVFVVSLALAAIGGSLRPLMSAVGPMMGFGSAVLEKRYAVSDGLYGAHAPMFSVRNVPPILPQPGGTGNDAEEYEVTDYSALIETRDKSAPCAAVLDLKKYGYVIFESANESDTSCSYTFKVERARVPEVLAVVKDLGPKELSENTYTIKRQVEDVTNEIEILQKKLDVIEETLRGALDAYDDVTALATRAQDVESLAKIIDSKIQIIERLTTARLAAASDLDRLARAKAEALDHLDYSYFYLSIYENRYLDWEQIGDSWKYAVKEFVASVSRSLQNATVNLVAVLFIALPYVLYLFILIVAAKHGWRAVKYIWKK